MQQFNQAQCTELKIKGVSMAKEAEVLIKEVPLNQIKLGKNSRMNISTEEIAGLMESIKETGLLQPIGVVPNKAGGYQIAYGNRRFLACSKLGHKSIPAIIHNTTKESDVDMKNLTENVQRRNLSLAESGRYVMLLKSQGLTQAEIAVRLGVGATYVSACIASYESVPSEYRDSLTMQIGGKRLPPGKIGMQTAQKIISARKSYHLTHANMKTLFQEAKMNKDFRPENIPQYAEALRSGAKDPVKKVKPLSKINVTVFISEEHEAMLRRKYVEKGPFSGLGEVFRNILSGKISQRIEVLENKGKLKLKAKR